MDDTPFMLDFTHSPACNGRPEKARHIAGWLLEVARALPAREGRITRRLMLHYTALCLEDFNTEVFCSQSRDHMLRVLRFFPTYAELHAVLKHWSAHHLACSAAMDEHYRASGLTDLEWENIQSFIRRRNKNFAVSPLEVVAPEERARRQRRAIRFLKQVYPRAWAYYLRTYPHKSDLEYDHKGASSPSCVPEGEEKASQQWADPAAIQASLASLAAMPLKGGLQHIALKMLYGAERRYNPPLLEHVNKWVRKMGLAGVEGEPNR